MSLLPFANGASHQNHSSKAIQACLCRAKRPPISSCFAVGMINDRLGPWYLRYCISLCRSVHLISHHVCCACMYLDAVGMHVLMGDCNPFSWDVYAERSPWNCWIDRLPSLSLGPMAEDQGAAPLHACSWKDLQYGELLLALQSWGPNCCTASLKYVRSTGLCKSISRPIKRIADAVNCKCGAQRDHQTNWAMIW